MTVSQTVELEGHIIDSGTMGACFAIVMDMGGEFDVDAFEVGRHKHEETYCRMRVLADSEADLRAILHELNQQGATVADPRDAVLEPAPADQVVPVDFYSTTNHPTFVRVDGEWLAVENAEMDCALVVDRADDDGTPRVHTTVLNAIEAGDLVVTGETGIRVEPPERPREADGSFGFMQGGVSSERPSTSLIEEIADEMRSVRDDDGSVLAVCGPAIVHAGGRNALADLVRAGYVDSLSAGNGFAVHDLERDLYGTSLGVDTESLEHPRSGHKHHIYTISEIVRLGGIPAAVAEGVVEEGVMYECVDNDVSYVLAGSIRDDGPLPDTITDAVEAQDAIREQAREADLVLMLSTLLHAVAVGNCLPSTTKTVCVDINPATVTQLLDRGSAQAVGMVTDIGTFLPMLRDELLEHPN
ncbi:TIGR00300 family protein [Salinadaptatus halalkaliphilus]|uniref:Ornithine cyclodeaminase n=1 Tax=Salinadaptatus halalkaliphilus TaxID=2419781 RepID=A0A4S3TK26_9EURY|nr:TIGR00300 family protein [Salinadaptatus halalkaliphilus]THE63265.1 TIGR00300 family protein [Salinadaptatus halalkaliphilus]